MIVLDVPLDRTEWTVGPAGTTIDSADGMVLSRHDRFPRWAEWGGDLDASEIAVVEVEVDGLQTQNMVSLSWRSEGRGRLLESGSLSQRAGRPGIGETEVFSFHVGREPGWSGRIKRLRVKFSKRPPRQVRLIGLRAVHLEPDTDVMNSVSSQAWVVEIGETYRSALMGLPGHDVTRFVDIADGSRLEFFWGVPASIGERVNLSVSAVPQGERGRAEEERLWEMELDPSEPTVWDRWNRATVDLGRLPEGGAELRFRTKVLGDFDIGRGMPWWGHPEVRRSTVDPRPNIIVICIDTLRADHLSLYGYHQQTSPVLDSWARKTAVVFETVVAPAPWTLPSHLSMFTGLSAQRHGVNHPAPVPSSFETLAERLRADGYATMAVTGGRYLHASYGLSQGFDAFSSPVDPTRDEIDLEVETALDWLGQARDEGPFFLFFHTYEVHDPYTAREPAYSSFGGRQEDRNGLVVMTRTTANTPEDGFRRRRVLFERSSRADQDQLVAWEDVDEVKHLYDSGIARADAAIGRIFNALETLGLAESTVIAVTSDHGEALGEHHLAGHTSLYDHDLLVPMVVRLPDGMGAGSRVTEQVRLIDLAPTILEIVGSERIADADGVSLLPLVRGASMGLDAVSVASMTNFGIALRTADGRKLIVQNIPWPAKDGVSESYDTLNDPGEERPLNLQSDETSALRRRLFAEYGSTAMGLVIEIENGRSSEAVVRLGSLGSLAVDRNSVKTIEPGTRCSHPRGGMVECALEPGAKVNLLFEEVRSSRVEIEVSIDGKQLDSGQIFRLDLGREDGPWLFENPLLPSGVRITARRQGRLNLAGPSLVDRDAELVQRLEALGYVVD